MKQRVAEQTKEQEASRRKGKIDMDHVRNILLSALKLNPPPSILQLSKESGYDRHALYNFPDLCKRIVRLRERHRLQQKNVMTSEKKAKASKQEMENKLLSSLAKEIPDPLEHIAKSMGVSSKKTQIPLSGFM